jgi:hypothetical protein
VKLGDEVKVAKARLADDRTSYGMDLVHLCCDPQESVMPLPTVYPPNDADQWGIVEWNSKRLTRIGS